jgi:short subunit dehydrogenase-like uncharacterized protein
VSDVDVDVFLYGASGFTGRLIAEELAASGLSFALGGRDRTRLERVRDDLGVDVPVLELQTRDAVGLERAARGARVVVSAAGPFVDLGPPVLSAALDAGSHFIDITGEQAYLRWAFEQNERAMDAGLSVVNAMGYDVVPSDLAALVASTAMRSVERVDIGLRTRSGLSGGTIRSMAQAVGNGWWYDHGRFRAAAPGRFLREMPFPEPTGAKWGVFIPWGDVVTPPQTMGAQFVRTFFCPGEKRAKRLHRAWPLVTLGWRTRLLRPALKRRAALNKDPSLAERTQSVFEIVAEALDDEGVVQRGYVTGRDPYGLTAALAVYGARALAREEAPRGVVTPMQAFRFGPLAEAMKDRFGFEWRARSLM